MNQFVTYHIHCGEDIRDMLIAEFSEAGMEGFAEEDDGFIAYGPEAVVDDVACAEILEKYKVKEFERKVEADHNWNEEWERDFQPVTIGSDVIVTAPFHKVEGEFKHRLVIQPKNTFGTGHHETTRLMLQLMMREAMKGKKVLDYGTGTGVLGIFALRLGAASVLGIDIDAWSAENISENVELNKVEGFTFLKGELEIVKEKGFDLVLANINKNILLRSFETLAGVMQQNGVLLISGFYETDLPELESEASKYGFRISDAAESAGKPAVGEALMRGLSVVGAIVENGWCAARFHLSSMH
jgi:ribosomal protein L11 methyltransferase